MQDRSASMARSKPPYKSIMRAGAFVAKYTVLQLICVHDVQIFPNGMDAAKFVREHALSVIQNRGGKLLSILVVGVDVILMRVLIGLSPVKRDKQHRSESRDLAIFEFYYQTTNIVAIKYEARLILKWNFMNATF